MATRRVETTNTKRPKKEKKKKRNPTVTTANTNSPCIMAMEPLIPFVSTALFCHSHFFLSARVVIAVIAAVIWSCEKKNESIHNAIGIVFVHYMTF